MNLFRKTPLHVSDAQRTEPTLLPSSNTPETSLPRQDTPSSVGSASTKAEEIMRLMAERGGHRRKGW
jgi:hypothetical protein